MPVSHDHNLLAKIKGKGYYTGYSTICVVTFFNYFFYIRERKNNYKLVMNKEEDFLAKTTQKDTRSF